MNFSSFHLFIYCFFFGFFLQRPEEAERIIKERRPDLWVRKFTRWLFCAHSHPAGRALNSDWFTNSFKMVVCKKKFTACKRSLGQGNIFTGLCHSFTDVCHSFCPRGRGVGGMGLTSHHASQVTCPGRVCLQDGRGSASKRWGLYPAPRGGGGGVG